MRKLPIYGLLLAGYIVIIIGVVKLYNGLLKVETIDVPAQTYETVTIGILPLIILGLFILIIAVGLGVLLIALVSIGLMISCLAKPTDSLTYSGIYFFVAFFIETFWTTFDENLQNIKYLGLETYFQPLEYLKNGLIEDILIDIIILLIISTTILIITIFKFNKKDIL